MNNYAGLVKLSLLLVVFPLLLWQVSFKKTLNLYLENKHVTEQTIVLQQGSKHSQIKTQPLDANITVPLLSNGRLLAILAPLLSKYKVEMSGYTPMKNCSEDGRELYTGTLILQGRFTGLIQTVYALEKMTCKEIKVVEAIFSTDSPKNRVIPSEQIILKLVLLQLEK